MDTIQCPHCKAEGIPHLQHRQTVWLLLGHMKTRHICRLCGQIMYVTGGGLNIIGYAACFLIFYVTWQIFHLGVPDWWGWKIVDPMINLLFLAFVGYKIYRLTVNRRT